MTYQVQISESYNGKIVRYETVAIYHDFKDAYKHFIDLLLNDDSELYNYRILEGNTVIEDAEDIDIEKEIDWSYIEREIEEELEACRKCAYNDCGSCSCYEKKSICCPYADDEEEGD